MVIALSHPKNVCDILTHAKFSLPDELNMQDTNKELNELKINKIPLRKQLYNGVKTNQFTPHYYPDVNCYEFF
jgi:hypothetical protein